VEEEKEHMMDNTSTQNQKVEMAAVFTTKLSMIKNTSLIPAAPEVDTGIDIIGFRPDPFMAVPVQVKGATKGLTIWHKHSVRPLIVSYVLDPLSSDPKMYVMTGAEAWELPEIYVERGGKASDFHADRLNHYRFPSVTVLLRSILDEMYAANEAGWAKTLVEFDRDVLTTAAVLAA